MSLTGQELLEARDGVAIGPRDGVAIGPPDGVAIGPRDGVAAIPADGVAAIAASFQMREDTRFDWHSHSDHQLVWAARGALIVLTETGDYVLPPTRALWIPAATPHETRASTTALMRSLYLRPARCPLDWSVPTPVSVRPLLAELISYLEGKRVEGHARARAEALVYDLLAPIRTAAIESRLPRDDRAHLVATALLAHPADRRTLAAWGREVGASDRTLARIFVAETGLTFGRWRTFARLQAALEMLADGIPVKAVAPSVGYETTSAFVAAFRSETGVSPGSYFRDLVNEGNGRSGSPAYSYSRRTRSR